MGFAEIADQRWQQQGLSHAAFKDVEVAVLWLGAVQAQDYHAAVWALGLRLPHCSVQDIEEVVTSRTIVRTWPMRGTIHFIPAADAKWMVDLMAGRALNKLKPMVLKQHGLDEAIYQRSKTAVVTALQGGHCLTRPALYEAMEAAGVATSNSRGLFLSGWMAHEGILCFGPREGKQPTFVLLDEWVSHHNRLERDEALAVLARRYFTSHGPATLQDFVWWTGLLAEDARAGINAVKSELIEETIEGKTWWRAPLLASAAPPTAPVAHLIPNFDEILVSYKTRTAALALLHHHNVHLDAATILANVVLINGQMVGTWKRMMQKNQIVVDISYLLPVSDAERSAVAVAAQRFGDFYGLPVELHP